MLDKKKEIGSLKVETILDSGVFLEKGMTEV